MRSAVAYLEASELFLVVFDDPETAPNVYPWLGQEKEAVIKFSS
jgi:hypothetical protein